MRYFKICTLVLFSITFLKTHSQSIISGTINDENGQPLSGATVIIKKDNSKSILAYDISNNKGLFETNVKDLSDVLIFKVSYLGYTTWIKNIPNKKQQLQIQLYPSTENLKEVFVPIQNIRHYGDTISYSVSAYKDQKDRVIADVIKKMPGIEIRPSGQILYQGNPIQKYYIEGLDLMGGRYNLANENISADDVYKVQILENHQPIKMLDSLVFSERASLNIKLKKNITISGNAQIGLGVSPLLWKAKITPMLFTKKRQAIISYQSNNTGTNISREIRDFSYDSYGGNFSIRKTNWLGLSQLSKPPFTKELWLDNNTHLASVNTLQKMNNDVILKINLSYLNDSQKQYGSSYSRFFTPTDTIDLREKKQNNVFINVLQSNIIIEKNTKKRYFKNNLEINRDWNSEHGMLQLDDTSIAQKLSNPFVAVRNKLHSITSLGKQLINLESNIGYTKTNQNLEVSPGQFLAVLNNGAPYTSMHQVLESTRLFTDNSAGFTKAWKQFTFVPNIGFSILQQQLNSDLLLADNQDATENNFKNRLEYSISKTYLKSTIHYESKDEIWNLRIETPISLLKIKLEDEIFTPLKKLNRLVFEPNFYLKKKLNAFWKSSIYAGLKYNYGDLQHSYTGYILTNYRSLKRYNTPISQQVTQTYNGSISYRNPLKQFFIKGAYSFTRIKRNLQYSNSIEDNGAIILQAIESDNFINYNNYSLGASKYLKNIKTTLKLNARYNQSNRVQLLNNTFTNVAHNNTHFNASIDSAIFSWLSAQYATTFSVFKTSFEKVQLQQIATNKHSLDLFFYLTNRQQIKCNGEYYYNSLSEENTSNSFLNLSYQYTFKEPRIDLNLSWNNILNTDEFVNIYTNEFSYVESSYKLRPSQILASIKFSF